MFEMCPDVTSGICLRVRNIEKSSKESGSNDQNFFRVKTQSFFSFKWLMKLCALRSSNLLSESFQWDMQIFFVSGMTDHRLRQGDIRNLAGPD